MRSRPFLAVALLLMAVASPARAEVQLTIKDGRVSLVAKDATLRQILTEWARVGQTRIVNVERVPGGPMSLQLSNVPEGQALDTLLRSLTGYMAAPRQTPLAEGSRFDRIIVMATLAAQAPGGGPQPQNRPGQPPQYQPPAAQAQTPQFPWVQQAGQQQAVPDEAPEEQPDQNRQMFPQPQFLGGVPPGAGPLPGQMQQPPAGPQNIGGVTVVGGAAPVTGVATPGTIVQPPTPPGQPPQPRRPGGGL